MIFILNSLIIFLILLWAYIANISFKKYVYENENYKPWFEISFISMFRLALVFVNVNKLDIVDNVPDIVVILESVIIIYIIEIMSHNLRQNRIISMIFDAIVMVAFIITALVSDKEIYLLFSIMYGLILIITLFYTDRKNKYLYSLIWLLFLIRCILYGTGTFYLIPFILYDVSAVMSYIAFNKLLNSRGDVSYDKFY
jgi:hypothetical protein